MRKILFIALLIVLTQTKAQTWQWAKSADGTGFDEGWAIDTDTLGNVFVTGKFGSPSITFGTYTLTNAGLSNVFIAKYDSNGNVLWAKSALGKGQYFGYSVSTDRIGNSFITGFFDTTITFGTYTLTNSGSNWDSFLAKYDSNGNVLWAKSAKGIYTETGNSVSADKMGNVFVTGYFNSPTLTLDTYTLTNSGTGSNVFIAKYDVIGNVLWAKNISGTEGYSISTDTSGNAFVTGTFGGPTVTFDTYTLTNTGSGNGTNNNVFIAKYNTNGNVLWAKNAGGTSNNYDRPCSVSTDINGNVFVAGSFNCPNITFGTYTLTNAGTNSNVFIAKYDVNGNVLWAKSAGGVGVGIEGDAGYDLSSDVTGNVYLTGGFYSSIIAFGTYTLTPPAGSSDPMFLVKYDANGNVLCASALASGGDDQCGVSADRFGNAYIAGDFTVNSLIVGSNTLTLSSTVSGGENIFVAKWKPDCNKVGIETVNTQPLAFFVYPNPNNGSFVISTNTTEKQTIQLYDVNGKVVLSQNINGKANIDANNLAEGVYNLSLISSNGVVNKRLVIVK